MKKFKLLKHLNINKFSFKNIDIFDVLIFIAFLISAYIRFWQISGFNFAFTFDQARDLLEIRPMAYFLDLKLTGPTTSINGLLLGPYYFYYLLPAFWFGGGSPQTISSYNVLSFLIVGFTFYVLLKKVNKYFAFYLTLFYLLSPQLFVITSYYWNANAAVYVAGLFFLSMFFYLKEKKHILFVITAILASITLQFEAAFGIVCVGYTFIIALLSKDKKLFGHIL